MIYSKFKPSDMYYFNILISFYLFIFKLIYNYFYDETTT